MFESYTEGARKTVFYARVQASLLGCTEIEAEHLVLGILQADPPLALRLLGSPEIVESIRARIAQRRPASSKNVPTSVDLPLSEESRRALAFASEEAQQLHHGHIGIEHVLLGISREEGGFAAGVLREMGINSAGLRKEASHSLPGSPSTPPGGSPTPRERLRELPGAAAGSVADPKERYRDLTALAAEGALDPLIGRDAELDRVLQILSRRNRNNPALIGEPGVGRTAIVEGLAQRIADARAPAHLAERRVLSIDTIALTGVRRGKPFWKPGDILCVEGLFDVAAAGTGWGLVEAIRVLDPMLSSGELRAIATGSPSGLQQTLLRGAALARHFDIVEVKPPSEAETLQILLGLKERYEKFHGVAFSEEAFQAAVRASRRFLAHRQLPDRAIDLIDEAGALARVRGQGQEALYTVTAEDIAEAIARRIGAQVAMVKRALAQEPR